MIKEVKLLKFNGKLCDNLYARVEFITREKFDDLISLYHRVYDSLDNKNWLKFRDHDRLEEILDKGGFIIGCYVDNYLVASALCETPQSQYKDTLTDIGMNNEHINSTYISGFVMVDPIYRGNSLHKTLLECRLEESIMREKKYVVTMIAEENIYSLNTVIKLGFDIVKVETNDLGIKRNILLKELDSLNSRDIEFTA